MSGMFWVGWVVLFSYLFGRFHQLCRTQEKHERELAEATSQRDEARACLREAFLVGLFVPYTEWPRPDNNSRGKYKALQRWRKAAGIDDTE